MIDQQTINKIRDELAEKPDAVSLLADAEIRRIRSAVIGSSGADVEDLITYAKSVVVLRMQLAEAVNSHASLIEERDRLLAEEQRMRAIALDLQASYITMNAALEAVMIGGNHLASQLISRVGADFAERFPEDEFPDIVIRRLGATVEYDMWCAWSAIMKARASLSSDQQKEG